MQFLLFGADLGEIFSFVYVASLVGVQGRGKFKHLDIFSISEDLHVFEY